MSQVCTSIFRGYLTLKVNAHNSSTKICDENLVKSLFVSVYQGAMTQKLYYILKINIFTAFRVKLFLFKKKTT